MDFFTTLKPYKTTLNRFLQYWKEDTTKKSIKLEDFPKVESKLLIGYFLDYLEKENLGLNIGIMGYDIYLIKDKPEFPDFLVEEEEYGYKYLTRKVFCKPEDEKGILINYERAIENAFSIINSLYDRTNTSTRGAI